MLSVGPRTRVYLAAKPVDMRKSMDGLAIMVQMQLKLDPFSEALFVFCNGKRDKLKILFWDHNGFWLYYKRLERGTFKWPTTTEENKVLSVTDRELNLLLDGFTIDRTGGHKPVLQRRVV